MSIVFIENITFEHFLEIGLKIYKLFGVVFSSEDFSNFSS